MFCLSPGGTVFLFADTSRMWAWGQGKRLSEGNHQVPGVAEYNFSTVLYDGAFLLVFWINNMAANVSACERLNDDQSIFKFYGLLPRTSQKQT